EQAKSAVAANTELKKSNTELRQTRDDLETALGRSLLRPLGLQTPGRGEEALPPLTGPEIEALWELVSQPSEGVRRRFVSEALRTPVFTRQLRNRATPALHATVGLDVQRRETVERLLLERLQAEALPKDQRADLALVAATLGDLSPLGAAAVGRVL